MSDTVWILTTLGGQPYAAEATLQFTAPDRVTGHGPCNRFSGSVERTENTVSFGPLRSTKRACPDLNAESAYFIALRAASRMTQTNDQLTLTGPKGAQLTFTAHPHGAQKR